MTEGDIESWCWQPDCLVGQQTLSSHHALLQVGTHPDMTLDVARMQNSKNQQFGLHNVPSSPILRPHLHPHTHIHTPSMLCDHCYAIVTNIMLLLI